MSEQADEMTMEALHRALGELFELWPLDQMIDYLDQDAWAGDDSTRLRALRPVLTTLADFAAADQTPKENA